MQMTTHEAASVPPHARRYDITGCHLAAIVLERLQYWTPKATIQREGVLWIAKSRADLMDETGLTAKQLRTSLEKLREKDLIETTQSIIGGKNVLHVRLTHQGLDALRSAMLKLGVLDEDDAL